MNLRDSEVICGLLKNNGYAITDDFKKADVVILNTCSVRQHAEDKVWSEVGRLKNTKAIIGIAGCMAQSYKQGIFERAPRVDFAVGPSDIDKIPEILKRLLQKGGQSPKIGDSLSSLFASKIWETDGKARPEEVYHTGFYQDKGHAYVVISEGCSNFCSYCVVPYTRGPLKNRAHKEIMKEIKEAATKGINSVTLLGQNVNAYKDGTVDFIKLLGMVDEIKGIKEFGFITSHPKDTSADLFKAMAGSVKLKKYLHLPVQSGSDRVLKLMNRGYNAKFYLDLADTYRKIVKGGALTTDIIVGFPSESAEDFQDTYRLMEDARFDAAFIFKYSARPHAKSGEFPDDVSRQEKEERHASALQLQKRISKEKRPKCSVKNPD